jgi:N4-(beta-N-acetylglucosaminyl)-L-asparaginase
MPFTRRDFLATTALTSASLIAGSEGQETRITNHKPAETQTEAQPGKRPVVISSANGLNALDGAYEMLRRGNDTLDAALFPCRAQEDDPNDDSVGYGGLPNAEGVVELDSCCMHGPTRRAGAVAGVRGIKNPSAVAKLVMERTDHVLLVAEGAKKFALAHGFKEEDLLTERSRRIWMLWKEGNTRQDSWGPGLAAPDWTPPAEVPPLPPQKPQALEQRLREMEEMAARLGIEPEFRRSAAERVLFPPTGTIHVSTLNEKGEMSGATTTSGLAWKIPGRVGDSPIIGAGCFTDQDVGSAGSTGRGEEVIKINGAHTIVENMRQGMSPVEAGLDALKRIARNYNNDMARLRFMNVLFYVLRKDGAYAGVAMWSGPPDRPRRFAVHDGTKRLENCVALFQGDAIGWPPTPRLPRS